MNTGWQFFSYTFMKALLTCMQASARIRSGAVSGGASSRRNKMAAAKSKRLMQSTRGPAQRLAEMQSDLKKR